MNNVSLDNILWLLSVVGQILLLLVMVQQRLYRTLPVFFAYLLFLVLSDPFFFLTLHFLHSANAANTGASSTYFNLYFAILVPQSLLELAVLMEVATLVIRPAKRSLPGGGIAFLLVILVVAGLATFFLSNFTHSDSVYSHLGRFYAKFTFGMAVLRLLFFCLLALFAQMLGIGWKSHVLQLASGLALNGAVILLTQIALTHLKPPLHSSPLWPQYQIEFRLLDQVRIIGYLCTLAYWAWSFARQEAPRKEFSPQMAQFLVSISGAVKRDRAAVARLSEK